MDPKVPIKESIGVSNVSAAQLADARAVASIVSVQNRFDYADQRSADAHLEQNVAAAGLRLSPAEVATLSA